MGKDHDRGLLLHSVRNHDHDHVRNHGLPLVVRARLANAPARRTNKRGQTNANGKKAAQGVQHAISADSLPQSLCEPLLHGYSFLQGLSSPYCEIEWFLTVEFSNNY